MKYSLFLLFFLYSFVSWANLHLAPPDFNIKKGQAIFVDFKKAHYELTYDMREREVRVRTRIEFSSDKSGRPLFDLIPTPNMIKINGERALADEISFPGGESKLRLLGSAVMAGDHVLEIENTFKENTKFMPFFRNVSSAFWIRDLKDRMFLEQYVPSNFEFDQYEMVLEVKFVGGRREQEIFTNGDVEKISSTHYRIQFPSYFTSSCPFFHTAPLGRFKRSDFTYTSISGRTIPITVYSPWSGRTKKFKLETIRVMEELEREYGAWPHPRFLAYGTFPGTGGMEHSGATATSLAALDHEMLHSYFAKGIMPANGNTGWIDEAIAAWRDNGYPRIPDPGFSGSNLGAHSLYQRYTDDRAYGLGSAFMAFLDWRLQDMGGLKAFLKGYFSAYKHQVVTTEHFKNNLEFWSGLDLSREFQQYIWGENSEDSLIHKINPIHGKISKQTLLNLLTP